MADDQQPQPKKSRRGHGEGAIYKRADGKWVGAIQLGWEDGKRKRKVVYGKTRAEVNLKLTRLKHEQNQGLPIQSASPTVAAYLDEWLETIVKPNVKPRTYESYRSIATNHLTPALGKVKLADLSQKHILSMMAAKRAQGASERNIAYMRSVLRIALNEARRLDLVHRNVAELVRAPKIQSYDARALDTGEAERLLKQVAGDRLEALYGVALSLGLRQSEAFGLRWHDIDLETGRLTVRHQLRKVGGKVEFVEPKSKRSRRTIVLPRPLQEMLRRHRKKQLEERVQAKSWADLDLVFCTPIGTPLDSSNVRKQFTAHLEAAKLPAIRFHDLRHSAATLLAARGVSQRTVMEILGHSQMSTTQNIYTHVTTDSMRDAAERMADIFEADKRSS